MARACDFHASERAREMSGCDGTTPVVELDVLGRRLSLLTDPDRLNEAGVVWGRAVTALADVCAHELHVEHRKRAAAAVEGANARPLNILELGAGTGALGIALAHEVPSARVLLTDLEPVARRCMLVHVDDISLTLC